MRINYDRNVRSEAMSKAPKQSGIQFDVVTNNIFKDGKWQDEGDKVITVSAINPKTNDVTSHLHMQIPIEKLDEVIEALTKIKINGNSI